MLFLKQNNLSYITLIISNLIPIYGVMYMNWSIDSIFFLYWSENIIIGFYTLVKIWFASKAIAKIQSVFLSKLATSFFFLGNYSIFTFVHGVFLFYVLLPLFDEHNFADNLNNIYELSIALFATFISHGISFITNFINKLEYKEKDPLEIAKAPYSRIMVMHFTVLFGMFLYLIFNKAILMLIVLIGIKTISDIYSHTQSHKGTVFNTKS